MWWTSLISHTILLAILIAVTAEPIVKTTKGMIRGQNLKSRSGRDYFSFAGIPYAKPPIEELRFKPPESVDTWDGILDGTREADKCIQINFYMPSDRNYTKGVEDCLYLNVYTPNMNGKLPVMVWIHGGGWYTGHSGSSLYGPEYFMDKDIVLVTFNYRLGILGFASTEDDVLPGNYGMKDQVAVLRWIRENVAVFGGNPDHVTIFGESVGGASGGYHMMSPMSKGLFHKVILQSGAPSCNWASSVPGLSRKRTEAIATMAGCHAENSKDILNCLKKLPATLLVNFHNRFFEWNIHPSVPFHPVIESCDLNQEAFLCTHPIVDFELMSTVPIMVGLTSGDGGVLAISLFNDTSLKYPELNINFNRMVASLLEYTHLVLPENFDEIGNKIMKMYYPSGKVDDNSHLETVDMITDGMFTSCLFDIPLKSTSPAYFYLFDYQNEFTFNKLYGECAKPFGVSHADELISLFKIGPLVGSQGLNKEDSEFSKVMVNIWTKFASSEIPTIDGTDDGIVWPAINSIEFEESSILHIESTKPKVIKNLFVDKYKFWKKLPIWSRLHKLKPSKSSNIKNEL